MGGLAMFAASSVEACPAFRLSRPARAQLVKAYEALSPEARQAVDLMLLALRQEGLSPFHGRPFELSQH
jgi:hypothetical protein